MFCIVLWCVIFKLFYSQNDTVTMAGRMLQSESDQYNRIFIIGTKDCSPPDVRAAFEHFGEITDVYMPRGKSSNEYKGGCYSCSVFTAQCYV